MDPAWVSAHLCVSVSLGVSVRARVPACVCACLWNALAACAPQSGYLCFRPPSWPRCPPSLPAQPGCFWEAEFNPPGHAPVKVKPQD